MSRSDGTTVLQPVDCITISLSGADNVGKTTQMSYMPIKGVELRSSIHSYDDQMNDLVQKGTIKEWWFTRSSHEEFINVIMRAVNKRASITSENITNFNIYDRGGIMFEAVCIATVAFKEKCDLTQAEKIYNLAIEKCAINIPCEDIRILLKHEHDQLYDEYQKLLQKQLQIQELTNKYTDVINVTNMSVVQVQNEIRAIVRNYCLSSSIQTAAHFNPMFEHVNVIIAFGGMSEAGKSSLAEGTCRKLESAGVESTRLKIAYFMELASKALGSDVYQLPEEKQADELVKQLDHYLRQHYWVTAVTIESLHRLAVTQALKQILGDLLQIVYVDTTLDTRLRRSCIDIETLHSKDLVKSSHGADKIKLEAATFILDNNDYTLNESINSIYEMVKDKSEKIKLQALLNKCYSRKINLFSHQFVLSAGSILIQKSTDKVCLIHQLEGKREWLLPKGRKNVNETLLAAAVRETFEETGYHCSLMPLVMKTRATPLTITNEHIRDISRKISDISEPLMISLREIEATPTNQKIIFWYVTQIDEQFPRQTNTQMMNENFEAKLVSVDEANRLLTYDDDKELVRTALELYRNTYKLH
jgi:adenylylsulfate kinase-like enzyme